MPSSPAKFHVHRWHIILKEVLPVKHRQQNNKFPWQFLLALVVLAAGCGCEAGGVTASASPSSALAASGGADTSTRGGDRGLDPATTPVARNGQLSVVKTQLVNSHGVAIQLRGMSTHGLQWYGWGSCINDSALDALASDWGSDLLRVSLYVQEDGYATDPGGFTAQADTIIDGLVARGLYALIDWHILTPGDPWYNLERAKTYFDHMTRRYGATPNVLYEIANEPNGVDWARIKAYAEELIPFIRARDPDGIVIVGTEDWSSFGVSGSSGPEAVLNNPLTFDNILYSFHFYAGSHQREYRDALAIAAASLPVFVTEWGTQAFTGDGPNDFASAQQYLDFLADKKISWTYWNFSDDDYTGAALVPGTCPEGPWSGDHLKPAGAWVRERLDGFPKK